MSNGNYVLNEVFEWVKSIGFALVIGAIVIVFARPSLILGPSMEPTFQDRQVVLVEKVSYFLHDPKRGDVIVAQTELPLNRWMNKSIIKRVVGLPGDRINIENGDVFINGQKYYEPYLDDTYTSPDGQWVVPSKSVFVMGDNRGNSNDSRRSQVGYVDYSDIKGKVYLRVFPFNMIAVF